MVDLGQILPNHIRVIGINLGQEHQSRDVYIPKAELKRSLPWKSMYIRFCSPVHQDVLSSQQRDTHECKGGCSACMLHSFKKYRFPKLPAKPAMQLNYVQADMNNSRWHVRMFQASTAETVCDTSDCSSLQSSIACYLCPWQIDASLSGGPCMTHRWLHHMAPPSTCSALHPPQ